MFPVLPFLAGIAVGASALGFARKAKSSPRIGETAAKARQKLRQTAVASLDAVHQSSGKWRDRIASEAPDGVSCCCASKDEPAAGAEDQPSDQPAQDAERKPRAKKAAE